MQKFNPNQQLEMLQGLCGYRLDLDSDFDHTKANNGLAGSAHAFLGTAIQCLLVGLNEPGMQLIEKSISWLEEAIATHEKPRRYAEDGTEAARYRDYALCKWLLHGQHDHASLEKFVQHEDRFLARSGLDQDKTEISFVLPGYVNARQHERTLEIFANTPGLAPPRALKGINNEAHMSYVISEYRLGKNYSDGEVADAANCFLTKNMNIWLVNGHAVRAAEWMKIVYGNNDEDSSPRQVLMRSYEYLGIERDGVNSVQSN